MGYSHEMGDPFPNNQSDFRSTDVLLTAYTTSLAFFDFFAILLNILLLLAMKKSQLNITEKLQIIKTVLLVLAGAICVPLDIFAAITNWSLMINVGKGSAEDVLLYTSPALFLAIALVRLRVFKSTFNPQVFDSAYAPVLLIMCMVPTLVCIITRLPWHFSLTTSELQTKGDLYFDICSLFVTSMLPITVGIYIYWKICRKLAKQRLGETVRNHDARSPNAIFAIHMMKESMMKSIMYACVTTAVTWLLVIVAKISSILLSTHFQWFLAYFKVLIIFMNPLCEGICLNSKKENIALLYRRHFRFNRVNIRNPESTAEKTFDTGIEMRSKPELSLFVVDEEEEKSSPSKSEEMNRPRTEVLAVNTVSDTPGQGLTVCSFSENCASRACMTEKLVGGLHPSRSPSLPHTSNQTEKESAPEASMAEVKTLSLKSCDTVIHPACLTRHNSDGTCRIGHLSPTTIRTKIAKLGRMRSELSFSPDQFPDERERLSPYPYSSSKPYSLDLPTRMLAGISMENFSEKCYAQQSKDREETESTVSDIGSFHNTPLSLSRHSKDTLFSTDMNDDSQEKTKQNTAKTNSLYRPRRSLNSRQVPGNGYPSTRLNRVNNDGTAQSDGLSTCGSLEFQYARRGHSRRGSKLSQQGSIYSISSFCPSLRSVTSITSGYTNLFEDTLFQNCPSTKSATSLGSQKKLLSSLSDYF